MITPSPTTKIDPTLARGTLAARIPASGTRPELVSLAFPNTSYEMHLRPLIAVEAQAGAKLIGTISVQARRIDVVQTGGKFVEPVAGRPRRVQGRVLGVRGSAVVVDAGVPVHLIPTDPAQKADGFEAGTIVACDVLDGATFAPRTA